MVIRLMSIAVLSGRIGYVVFEGGRLKDWKISRKAAKSEDDLRAVLDRWTRDIAPDAVVTEELTPTSRKRGRSVRSLATVRAFLAERNLLHVRILRERPFQNKYVEAEYLITKFPELAPWKPVREKFWNNEPHSVVIFEVVALAQQVLRDPTGLLAKGWGISHNRRRQAERGTDKM